MERRGGRGLWIVDIAVPRDVDPGGGDIFGVILLDIDALRAFGEQSLAQRRAEIGRVRTIVAEELDRFRVDRFAREFAPLVTALRVRADDFRTSELDRVAARLEELGPVARDLVDEVTRRL